MISIDSVIALHNTFVTGDKLSAPQLLRGMMKPSQLKHIVERESDGYLVKTKSFEILVSPDTMFVLKGNHYATPEDMVEHFINIPPVLTATGFEDIVDVIRFVHEVPMIELFRKNSEIFLAEGFFLY